MSILQHHLLVDKMDWESGGRPRRVMRIMDMLLEEIKILLLIIIIIIIIISSSSSSSSSNSNAVNSVVWLARIDSR
jgi:hypothetical protein